ncbi:unnamed protein product [Acidithrix sp. C25]|nr:unnamed protein product [Acidithrix sp. C25]
MMRENSIPAINADGSANKGWRRLDITLASDITPPSPTNKNGVHAKQKTISEPV